MSDTVAIRLVLKAGHEKAARGHHPWVFSGAIGVIEGDAVAGAIGDLYDPEGEFVARGMVNRRSQITFRALGYRKEPIDLAFFRQRIEAAARLRRDVVPVGTDAYRLVNGEGDLLPGLVVDHYSGFLVCQFGAAGMDRARETILEALEQVVAPRGIFERSEGPGRREEGLEERVGPLRGEEPPERLEISEGGLRFAVDVRRGHKTGFYLDQRPARALVRELARGRRVLDVFSYSGGFAVAAAVGGASAVTAVETSAASRALLGEHLALNQLAPDAVESNASDAFDALRAGKETFDLVILDPPPFAKRKAEVAGACRGYKDVNLQAMRRLSPGGFLLTSSCSHHVDARLFQQILFGAAKDAGRSMQVLARLGQPADHPFSIHHPEGEYLKVFLLRAIG